MTCLEEFLRGSVFSRKRIQQHSLGLQSCIWGGNSKDCSRSKSSLEGPPNVRPCNTQTVRETLKKTDGLYKPQHVKC